MSCVSVVVSTRVVAAPRASADKARRAVVRSSGGVRGRVTTRRASVVVKAGDVEDLDAQGV